VPFYECLGVEPVERVASPLDVPSDLGGSGRQSEVRGVLRRWALLTHPTVAHVRCCRPSRRAAQPALEGTPTSDCAARSVAPANAGQRHAERFRFRTMSRTEDLSVGPLAQGIFRRQRGAAEPGVPVRRVPLRKRGRLERLHVRPQPRAWRARRHGRDLPIERAALDEQRRRPPVEEVHGARRYACANTLTRPGSPSHSTTVKPWSSTRRGRELVS
jgi:hypothetical protein